jgi:putative transposase
MNIRLTKKNETKEKRKSQTCKVYEVKIDRSHLSKSAEQYLNSLFKEAKWFYNYCLSHDNMNDADTTLKKVPVKVGDKYETRYFDVLTSQMKQGIKTRLFGSLMSLAALKEQGYKVGRLKFKGVVNSVPLKQFNNSYYIRNGKIRLQGMKRWLKVNGLEQIPAEADIACATLIRRNSDYYINITTYTNKQKKHIPEAVVGIDFGCETQLTFDNGIKVEFQVKPTKRLRRLDRKIMKKRRKDSKNKEKDKEKRRIEYEKLTNRRKDIRHKIVSAVVSNYRYVAFQDESIAGWKASGHGKKVQFSGIGSILADLKHKAVAPLEVDKFFPSTKLCLKCNKKNTPTLADRVYECECGFVMDRDVKSAKCIKEEGMKQIPTERRKFTLGEISTSTFLGALSKIKGIQVGKLESLSQEAPPSLAAG